jgi:hypothetical protein
MHEPVTIYHNAGGIGGHCGAIGGNCGAIGGKGTVAKGTVANPVCGTSRNTLALIREAGIEPRVVEYLKTPPDGALLRSLLLINCPIVVTPRGCQIMPSGGDSSGAAASEYGRFRVEHQ